MSIKCLFMFTKFNDHLCVPGIKMFNKNTLILERVIYDLMVRIYILFTINGVVLQFYDSIVFFKLKS